MKSVLISIRPKWCEKIANGEKTVEVRKTKPKLETPFKCYIYCTKGKSPKDVLYLAEHVDGEYVGDYLANGKVIGEFVCDEVFLWNQDIHDNDTITLEEASELSCLSEDELLKYADGYFYGWHISDLVIYDEPKELREFSRHDDSYDNAFGWAFDDRTKSIPITSPPQSWCYVEEL